MSQVFMPTLYIKILYFTLIWSNKLSSSLLGSIVDVKDWYMTFGVRLADDVGRLSPVRFLYYFIVILYKIRELTFAISVR